MRQEPPVPGRHGGRGGREQSLIANATPSGDGASAPSVTFCATAVGADEADRIVVHGALGPLEGIVLWNAEPGFVDILFEKMATDTVVLVPPLAVGDVELSVFSRGNRPLLQRVRWTAGQDTVRVTLRPPVEVSFHGTVQAGVYADRERAILAGLANMEQAWRENALGIRLGKVVLVDGTAGGGESRNILSAGLCADTTHASGIEASFVTSIDYGSYSGWGCLSGRIYLGLGFERHPFLLAHEVGHTFSLQHTSTGLMNPMAPGGDLRVGEVFHAHFDRRSSLNAIFGAQPDSLRRLCLGRTESPCLPDDFEFSGAGATSPASLQSPGAGWRAPPGSPR